MTGGVQVQYPRSRSWSSILDPGHNSFLVQDPDTNMSLLATVLAMSLLCCVAYCQEAAALASPEPEPGPEPHSGSVSLVANLWMALATSVLFKLVM